VAEVGYRLQGKRKLQLSSLGVRVEKKGEKVWSFVTVNGDLSMIYDQVNVIDLDF